MKKTRKYLAFILAMGLMLSSMTVFAAEPVSESASEESASKENVIYIGFYSGGIVDVTNYYQYVYYG